MEPLQSRLQPFYGYLELGLYTEANDELERLPDELKTNPLVLLARLELLMIMERWEDGAILGESLCKLWPEHFDFWFRWAYCLHERKRTNEAKKVLFSAPVTIRATALFNYNMACYEAQLGDLESAKALLGACFTKDATFKGMALDDPDLEPIWDDISG